MARKPKEQSSDTPAPVSQITIGPGEMPVWRLDIELTGHSVISLNVAGHDQKDAKKRLGVALRYWELVGKSEAPVGSIPLTKVPVVSV